MLCLLAITWGRRALNEGDYKGPNKRKDKGLANILREKKRRKKGFDQERKERLTFKVFGFGFRRKRKQLSGGF